MSAGQLPPTPGPHGFRKPPKGYPLPNLKVRPEVPLFRPAAAVAWNQAKAELIATANAITDLLLYEINAAVVAGGKTVSADGFQEFGPALRGGVMKKLIDDGDWNADQANVIAAARQMGAIAVLLAGTSAQVSKGHLHPAFYAVQSGSTVCSLTAGSGSWCDFFI